MDEIFEIKSEILRYLHQQVSQGMERADINEIDMLVDMVKDLSDAEYKCSVVEAMAGDYGYTPHDAGMGYDGMGYGSGSGSGRYGYDPQALRDMWAGATPEEREQMKRDMGM